MLGLKAFGRKLMDVRKKTYMQRGLVRFRVWHRRFGKPRLAKSRFNSCLPTRSRALTCNGELCEETWPVREVEVVSPYNQVPVLAVNTAGVVLLQLGSEMPSAIHHGHVQFCFTRLLKCTA